MATGNTANYNLPYPVPTDPVDVAGDIQELSDSLDTFLTAPAFINNLSINGGSVVTSSATASIFNTGATTLNIGGAATVINVGASAGQVNVRGNFNILTGKVYEINDVEVLSASALGSGIVSSSLTSVGTITTGTWNATTISVDKGGTGFSSYTIGDIIYASASTTLAKLAGVATGNALISGGVGVAPSWGKIDLTTHVSGTLPVANGGTGITSLGTGIATWLGTPSSANLAAAITDETGSGALVFATSPTLTTPNIGAATGTSLSTTSTITASTTSGRVLIGVDAGGSISLGRIDGVASTPYLDFNSGSTLVDYDVRIQSSGGNGTAGNGSLTISGTTLSITGSTIIMESGTTGAPTDNVSFKVERGTSPDVEIRWNETGDAWQFTNDGTAYYDIPTAAGGGAGLEAVLMFGGM